MKPINELKISPLPWYRKSVVNGHKCFPGNIHSGGKKNGTQPRVGGIRVCGVNFLADEGEQNARLIVMSPKMYECIFEAIPLLENVKAHANGDQSANEIDALVTKMRHTLEQAAGESEV